MSLNYYAVKRCETCGNCERLHIGKSACGWCFALHVEPDDPTHPSNLAEWRALFRDPAWSIVDAYDDPVSTAEMLSIICDRSGNRREPESRTCTPGPRGLWRQRADDGSIWPGEGTWDYVRGEFS